MFGKKKVIVKKYKSEKAYEKDANRMLARGFHVQDVAREYRRRKARWFLVSGLLLIGKKVTITVTYGLGKNNAGIN